MPIEMTLPETLDVEQAETVAVSQWDDLFGDNDQEQKSNEKPHTPEQIKADAEACAEVEIQAMKEEGEPEAEFTNEVCNVIQSKIDNDATWQNIARLQWSARRAELEEEIAALSVQIADLKAEAKDISKDLKKTVEKFKRHTRINPTTYTPDEDDSDEDIGKDNEVASTSNAERNETQQSPYAATMDKINNNHGRDPLNADAWRSVPITALDFDSIKGFGKKKREALAEACPTIGQFEDLRATFDGLRSIEGIGLTLAGELENAMLEWLSKNRDNQALNFAGNEIAEAVTPQDVVETVNNAEPAAAAKNPNIAELAYMTPREWDALTDGDQHKHLRKLAKAINSGTLTKRFHENPEFWNSGSDAQKRDLRLIDCPYQPGVEQDDWIRGWLWEDSINTPEAEPTQQEDNVNDNDNDEADGETTRWQSLAQSERAAIINPIAVAIDTGEANCLNCVEFGEAWDAGAAAYLAEQIESDCPHPPGPIQNDWLRGFVAQELISQRSGGAYDSPRT